MTSFAAPLFTTPPSSPKLANATPSVHLAALLLVLNAPLLPSLTSPALRFAKHLLLTYALLAVTHTVIRNVAPFEQDDTYDLSHLLHYDLRGITLDTLWYYIVSRSYVPTRASADTLRWSLPVLVGALDWSIPSPATPYSLSFYAMMCAWPWQPWLFYGIGALAVIIGASAHVREASRKGLLQARVGEIAGTVAIFLLVNAGDSNLHLHHYYAAWLIGQHFNLDPWWSQVTSALLWGVYVNGVAAWGRDPLLGCKEAYYLSENQWCGFLDGCENAPAHEASGANGTEGGSNLTTGERVARRLGRESSRRSLR